MVFPHFHSRNIFFTAPYAVPPDPEPSPNHRTESHCPRLQRLIIPFPRVHFLARFIGLGFLFNRPPSLGQKQGGGRSWFFYISTLEIFNETPHPYGLGNSRGIRPFLIYPLDSTIRASLRFISKGLRIVTHFRLARVFLSSRF